MVEEDVDLTMLKDTKDFLEQLAKDRYIWEDDVIHRVSLDGGAGSLKIICNTFSKNQDSEVLFTRTEQPGNLCSGVNRSIVLAFAEGVDENHHNLRIVCELLDLHKLNFVVASDLKLLNVLAGLSGHGGKYACVYCEGEMGLDSGTLRTFGSIIEHNQDYVAAGCPTARMKQYKNCINLPLLDVSEDQLVLAVIPPPELHLLMGSTNVKLEVIRSYLEKLGLEQQLWEWCSQHGVTRRGYNGKNKLDGNNRNSFLKQMEKLTDKDWWPSELDPVLDCLNQLELVKDKTFGWELKEGWEGTIALYKSMFSELQVYCNTVLAVPLSCTWKIHMITAHLQPFLSLAGCGLACYAEHKGESIHFHMKPVISHYRRKSCHLEHGQRQLNAVVEFSSNNL